MYSVYVASSGSLQCITIPLYMLVFLCKVCILYCVACGFVQCSSVGSSAQPVSGRHGFKPRRSLNFFQASISAIALIAVYLRGQIWFISYIICHYEIYRGSTLVHYDPTREDHKQFEQITEKETEKPDARPTLAQEKQSEETALPEVSQDKYYEANTSVLANFFGSKKEVRWPLWKARSHTVHVVLPAQHL